MGVLKIIEKPKIVDGVMGFLISVKASINGHLRLEFAFMPNQCMGIIWKLRKVDVK